MPSKSGRKPSIAQLLKKAPKAPKAFSKRLNSLIDESKVRRLEPAEETELRKMMVDVDDMTIKRMETVLTEYIAVYGKLPPKKSRPRSGRSK